jgi:hypothetical protein
MEDVYVEIKKYSTKEVEMSDIRIPVFHCPFCGKVKKHGVWEEISTEKLVRMYRATDIVVVGVACPDCNHLKHNQSSR